VRRKVSILAGFSDCGLLVNVIGFGGGGGGGGGEGGGGGGGGGGGKNQGFLVHKLADHPNSNQKPVSKPGLRPLRKLEPVL
jgi:hypothetical protein